MEERKEALQKYGILYILTFIIVAIAGIGWYENKEVTKCPIRINEVCSNNFSIISDEAEDRYFDYIELYNKSEQDIALDGFFLSDNRDELQMKELSGLVIGGKSFLLIAATGEDNGIDRATFCLNSKGDVVYLSNADKKLVDMVKMPKLRYDQVYARAEDGDGNWQVMSATPMKTNRDGESIQNLPERYMLPPEFSVKGGFYEEEFKVSIVLNSKIKRQIWWNYPGNLYYTLDGSIPTKASFMYKEDGIVVGKGVTAIRARYIDENGLAGDIASVTYFVGQEEMSKADYVVSIMADKEDLYGEENGICAEGREYQEWVLAGSVGDAPKTNFEQKGNVWEREANVEIFMPNGTVNRAAGIKVQGGASRGGEKKRFTLVSREIYSGEYYFPISLFGGKKLHGFYFRQGFANAVYPKLVTDRAVATQEAVPASIYLNGAFYYNAYLTEKFNKDYFAQTYGVTTENVIIISDGELNERESDRKYFDELLIALDKDLSRNEAYWSVQEKMDIQSYIDFLCIQIYIGNLDIGDVKNIRMWRTRKVENTEYGDGKWRWVLYDLDDCDGDAFNLEFYGLDDMAKMNTFTIRRRYSGNSYHDSYMYMQLRKNKTFCRQFVSSFMDMVNENFSEKNVEKIFSEYGGAAEHRNGFFLKRKQYMIPYLAAEFDLQGTLEMLEIQMDSEDGGCVEVNTIKPDLSSGVWRGEYFTDYPVALRAVCKEGYQFVRWEGDIADVSETIEIMLPVGGISVKPIFKKI